ncbi:MAG: nickel pincer cofactor biosynthesis protein LarB [Eubacteriales bacterium]|nr:nickel pincer cofactor biosynthesis protein LarB [Eubacteriales bacterium]
MDKNQSLELLYAVKRGEATPEEVLLKFKQAPYEDLGYAKIDHHRRTRQGVPEVIFGQNKTPEQIAGIVESMLNSGGENILISRMSAEAVEFMDKNWTFEYHPIPKMGIVNRKPVKCSEGYILVASGGTSDMFVAEEAALTAEVLGNQVVRLYDVGVSGLHRLIDHLPELAEARVVIAVAGMEGALASVVGGLVDCPVIAVPTSVGYGASFGGISALLSMLNSCASGISVVNIDNGFGAGFLANRINKMGGTK